MVNLLPNQTLESPELTALRRRKLELKQKRLSILKQFGLLHYKPHAKQDAFHRAANYRRRMVSAGNRFGKSEMGCAEDCAFLLGKRPWYPEGDPARYLGIPQHPNKGLVITTDFGKIDEVWTSQSSSPGKIWRLLPNDFVKSVNRNSTGVIDTLHCWNQSILRFEAVKAFKNNPQSTESADYDFIHVDEPCPEDMWISASRGLVDRHGSAWFTLTPLKEVWINDMFFPRRSHESKDEAIRQGSKWAIRGSMYDNTYLSREAIAEFESTLSEDQKQCRLYGLPLDLSGLVYKEFSYDKHVLTSVPHGWKDFSTPPIDYTIYYAADTHMKTPHAILFCAVSPNDQKFFWYEIFETITISNLATLIHPLITGRYVAAAKLDPFAYILDPITGTCVEDEFCKHGIFFEKATKALKQGILRVKEELLKPNNYYFSPLLQETLWEFERYVWDDDNEPVDKNDHMMENLYRLTLTDLRYIDISKITNKAVEEEVIDKADLTLDDYNYHSD